MRDLSLVLCVVLCMAMAFRYPYAGVLTWGWLTYMNPHMAVFSFAAGFPFNLFVAIITIALLILRGEFSKLPPGVVLGTMIFLAVWTSITTLCAYDQAWSSYYWGITIKTFVFVVLVMATTTTKVRLHALIWVIVISVGYYGIKGGMFSILHGGSQKVFGPENTIIFDNNQLGVALVLVLPLANYLRLHSRNGLVRLVLVAAMLLIMVAVVSTYSRGATIALGVMVVMLWLRSRNKLLIAVLLGVFGALVFNFMPDEFFQRLNTLNDAAEGSDESFRGRIDAWYVATAYALDHFPLGAGFAGPQLKPIFEHYLPGHDSHAAHSIYFQVLGEHGVPGLIAYVIMLIAALANWHYVLTHAARWPGWEWVADLARMAQVSLVSFYVGGASLSLAYYDVMLTIVALSAVARRMVQEHQKAVARPTRPS